MNLMDSNNTIWKVVRAVCLHLLLAIQACTPSLGLSQPEFVFSAFFGYMVSIIGSNNALQISDVVESDKSRISKNIVKVAKIKIDIYFVFCLWSNRKIRFIKTLLFINKSKISYFWVQINYIIKTISIIFKSIVLVWISKIW